MTQTMPSSVHDSVSSFHLEDVDKHKESHSIICGRLQVPGISVQAGSKAITNERKYSKKQPSGRNLATDQERDVFSSIIGQLRGDYASKRSLDIVSSGSPYRNQENHTSIKRYLRREIVKSLKDDRERWWTEKAQKMEKAFAIGDNCSPKCSAHRSSRRC